MQCINSPKWKQTHSASWNATAEQYRSPLPREDTSARTWRHPHLQLWQVKSSIQPPTSSSRARLPTCEINKQKRNEWNDHLNSYYSIILYYIMHSILVHAHTKHKPKRYLITWRVCNFERFDHNSRGTTIRTSVVPKTYANYSVALFMYFCHTMGKFPQKYTRTTRANLPDNVTSTFADRRY